MNLSTFNNPKHTGVTAPKNHYKSVHNCNQCPYYTKSIFFMRNHVKRHRSSNPINLFDCFTNSPEAFYCRDCDFKTYLTLNFNAHMKNKHVLTSKRTHKIRPKTYNCRKCSFESYSRLFWYLHVRRYRHFTRNLKKWLQCVQCTFKTKRKTALKEHKNAEHSRVNLEPELFKCEFCPYRGKQLQWLKRHVSVMHEECVLLRCNQCSFKTKYKNCLKLHKLFKHTDNKDVKWFQCEKCSYKSKTNGNLKEHILLNHVAAKDVQWFHCDQCDYKNRLKKRLNKHARVHLDDENANWFRCLKCAYKSQSSQGLRRHELLKHVSKGK